MCFDMVVEMTRLIELDGVFDDVIEKGKSSYKDSL
jgi:hypothetical protein